ncbi:hypothetical protein DFH07DRAFT_862150 [Mycena maculata]|uniref:Uncharacterized protein n=1 Tax=Mycena maculata TaxID=230809 RepID=A0AAD7HBF7_9AGAR|nr:hypothetical protein DFH07DRAFT_862150 [Mycena maculata]
MSFPIEVYRSTREMPPRIPQPAHRHGQPSGPWPFLDLGNEEYPVQLARSQQTSVTEPHKSDWSEYPQSLYPNWTPAQQQKSGIMKIINRGDGHFSREPCTIHHVNVMANGIFSADKDHVITEDTTGKYWKKLLEDWPDEIRLRALFIDNLSGPVLQMLGTRYNVEPFFFSSSLNWIPARYQESVGEGDHITLTLTFIRSTSNPASPSCAPNIRTLHSADQVIDTQAPLTLSSSDRILLPDILAIHMVRSPNRNTILSYHPPHAHRTTAAHILKTRLLAAGQSVYWNKIFTSTISSDPTFVLLSLLWYPLYAFDEAFEALYDHISWLESRVMATTDMTLTQQLHVVRAHLLHYASLLEDFRKSVAFVAQTPNPVLEHAADAHSADVIAFVKDLMRKESANLLDEIARLEQNRSMQDNRLKNVMNLAFSSVNVEDSRRMQKLTEAALKDSEVMKQISYLTMFFLPASFSAAVFGMNIEEITPKTNGTLPLYFALTVPLTAVTIWIIMAFRYRKKDPNYLIHDDDEESMGSKFLWPLAALSRTGTRAVTFSRRASTRMSGPNRGA